MLETLPPGLEKEKHIAEALTYALLDQRKYPELSRMAENLSDEVLARNPNRLFDKYLTLGVARMALDDEPAARDALRKTKAFAEDLVEQVEEPQKMPMSTPNLAWRSHY